MKKLYVAIAALTVGHGVIAKTLTVALDFSGSNALIADQSFATMAANAVYKDISNLEMGDTVNVVSFGARGGADNIPVRSVVLSSKKRPKSAAKKVANLVSNLPSTVTEGQTNTNIVSFFQFTSGFNCVDGSKIFLITDGLEASSYVAPSEFKSGLKSLPEPGVDLSGCEVMFYGLGVGQDQIAVGNMRKAWKEFIGKSGATYKDYIPN
jgi:hypothetical protein